MGTSYNRYFKLLLVCAFALCIASPAWGEIDVLQIPSADKATFKELSDETAAGIPGQRVFEAGGPVVQMIIGRQVVITALERSIVGLRVNTDGSLEITPTRGTVHVLTGSQTVTIDLEGHQIKLTNASVTFEAASTGQPIAAETMTLQDGAYALHKDGTLSKATTQHPQLATRLQIPRRVPTPPKAFRIAKLDDIRIDTKDERDLFEDYLELEEIEIEAGCIEICVD